MRDALVVVDVLTDFDHPDGARLRESFRARQPALCEAIDDARRTGMPVIYVNDSHGSWSFDVPAEVRSVIEASGEPELMAAVAPQPGDAFMRKPRYSAFDHTALDLLLRDAGVERILLVGAATEMCIVQTAIDARELGLKVTILARACATVDPQLEAVALTYAERVAGARIVRD